MLDATSTPDLIAALLSRGYRCLAPINQLQDVDVSDYAADIEAGKKAVWCLLDTEGFGPDVNEVNPATAELIELGIITLLVDLENNTIMGKVAEYDGYRDPGMPVPPFITELTGITDDMVKGQALDLNTLEIMLADVSVFIAHNASYDRPVVERCVPLPVFKNMSWVCSLKDIDWASHGITSAKLDYLVVTHGFWYEAHRADIDCLALCHVLMSQPAYVQALAQSIGKTTSRLYATGSNISLKDVLKARGYKWSPGENGQPKSWYKDVLASDERSELAWLSEYIYMNRPASVLYHGLPSHARFSLRAPTVKTIRLPVPTETQDPSDREPSYMQQVEDQWGEPH